MSGAVDPFPVDVRNQWTYHARLYAAAKFVGEADKKTDINLVQLVSFGCGVDAVTTDEVRFILEKNRKANCRYRDLFQGQDDKAVPQEQ